MDCREFALLTKDFIHDEIKDNRIVVEYLNHAKECKECYDELEVIYSMHRSLGDIMGPDGKDESSDYVNELKEIDEYYNDWFESEKKSKHLYVMLTVMIVFIVSVAIGCFFIEYK